jgi:hypothetical protein
MANVPIIPLGSRLTRLTQSAGKLRPATLTSVITKAIAEHIPGNYSRQSSH